MPNIDFARMDMLKVLEASMPLRFQDIPPHDFEDFIAHLLRQRGYAVDQTSYTADYGADLIIQSEEERIAVQVKRYSNDNKVGVADVNQVIGARDYYKCERAIIITTSSFTKNAIRLATKTETELWDWDTLQQMICETHLGGQNYYSIFRDSVVGGNELEVHCSLHKVQCNVAMHRGATNTIVYTDIANTGGKNIELGIEKLVVITDNNRQVESSTHLEQYFRAGMVYAGCSVQSAMCFGSVQLAVIPPGSRLILQLRDSGGNQINLDVHKGEQGEPSAVSPVSPMQVVSGIILLAIMWKLGCIGQ